MDISAIVLAAGAGTRMKSDKPKVAHTILGKPLIRWVVDAAHEAGIDHVVSVLGHQREQVIPLVEDDTHIVFQEQRLGTGDAVAAAREHYRDKTGTVVVLSGDCPLVTSDTIKDLICHCQQEQAAMAVLTMDIEDPFGYGRIERDAQGHVLRIVEQKDCTPEQAKLTECNTGLYCFDIQSLFWALDQVDSNNAQGEYYLTDVLEICRAAGKTICAVQTQDARECLGVNSRVQLAEASKIMQERITTYWMNQGVSMPDPSLVWIDADVRLEQDVELLPMTTITGASFIGQGSIIGPNTRLHNTQVGSNCVVDETIAQSAVLEEGVHCGPRAYLREGTHMCAHSKAGTHVEIKKSTIGVGSKVPHLSYIGDTTMGSGVNIGAGSITCNYDGELKHATVIEDGVFIGSNTMMVAPVTIGSRAITGAGSVITQDVSPDALALGRARQIQIEEYRTRRKNEKKD